jgi:hypothetical protein
MARTNFGKMFSMTPTDLMPIWQYPEKSVPVCIGPPGNWNRKGQNILGMGVEAMYAPFESQVQGLIVRARELEDQVRSEIESGF